LKVDMAFLEQLDLDFNGKVAAGKGSPSGEFAAILQGLTSGEVSVDQGSSEIEAALEKLENFLDMDQLITDAGQPAGGFLEGEEAEQLLQKIAEKILSVLMQGSPLAGSETATITDSSFEGSIAKLADELLTERGEQLTADLRETLKQVSAEEQAGLEFEESSSKASMFLQQLAEKVLAALSGGSTGKEGEAAPKSGSKVDWSLLAGDPGGEALLYKVAGKLKSGGEGELPPDLKAALKEAEFLGEKAKAVLTDTELSGGDGKKAFIEEALEKAGLKMESDEKPLQSKEGGEKLKADADLQKALEAARNQSKAEYAGKAGEQKAKAAYAQKTSPAVGQDSILQQSALMANSNIQAGKELPPQLETLRENIMQQLEGRLTYFRETGSTPAEMRMTLHPPELGEVTIRVFSRQGQLSASIITESAVVKEILESSITELRQRLNFSNIQFEQIDVSTQSQQFNGSSRFGAGEHNHENLPGGDHEGKSPLAGEQEVAESMVTADAAKSGIDYWA